MSLGIVYFKIIQHDPLFFTGKRSSTVKAVFSPPRQRDRHPLFRKPSIEALRIVPFIVMSPDIVPFPLSTYPEIPRKINPRQFGGTHQIHIQAIHGRFIVAEYTTGVPFLHPG